MRRRQSSTDAKWAQGLWNKSAGSAVDALTVDCKLVTPMYGGGVEAGKVDRAMPIRASGIRGQLRFWWRLLYSKGRKSDEIFHEECELWGGIASSGPRASKVALRVQCEPVEDTQLEGAEGLPPYVLISDSDAPKLLKERYQFKVVLGFSDNTSDHQRQQVAESLRWWASFGGVGARTRRGLGAVRANSNIPGFKPVSREEVKQWGGRIVVGPPQSSARDAWKSAIRPLQLFRQGTGVGRKRGVKGPGGSNWPEADMIRRFAGKTKPGSANEDAFFPRATFGLPIVFQFKGEKHLNDTLEVEGEERERMASPLILRPYFDGRGYCAMALLLPGWEQRMSKSVALKDRGHTGRPWPSDAEERERLAAGIEPMKGHGNDPLTAFMHYFEERVNAKQSRR